LFGLDYVKPETTTPVTEGMTIEIVRVTEEVISTTETIPYDLVYQSSAEMNLDEKAVVQAGQNGTVETSTRIRYENGVEVSRSDESSVITQNPTDEIIAYGTNIVLQTIDTPDGARQYWRTFRVYATSYHPEALGGDDVTAIGAKLQKGIIGADPKIIPWRTEMYVPGYGIGMMADTGGPRSSPYWIDLGYSDEDWEAWYHYVDVYLLTPIPDEINYLLPTWTALR
jgi:3D (Asp-Asp-Asp) domain-containing protein